MLEITRIRHSWPEPDQAVIDRPQGSEEYILLHYWNPVLLRVGGETLLTKPNAFHVISPHTPQWFMVKGSLVHDWIHITGEVRLMMQRFSLEPDRLYYPKASNEITALVHDLENEFTARRAYYEQTVEAKLMLLFITVSRSLSVKTEKARVDAATEASIRQLRMKMMLSLEQNWNVAKMAAEVSVSPSWFYPLYQSVFGITPTRDLILCRVEKAREWLETSDVSVGELAEKCGYTNEYHFIRQFRSITGTTPKQYRLANRRRRQELPD